MFGIRYLKASPTTYVLQLKDGRVKREGLGLSFFYYAPTSLIVQVPTASVDVPFVFNETTADFQPVTLQGQLTWRIADAKRAASLLDFSVTAGGAYASDDPKQIPERLVYAAQVLARGVISRLKLREALGATELLVREIRDGIHASEAVTGGRAGPAPRVAWEERRLLFAVREPFLSRHSQAGLVAGLLENEPLVVESLMPQGGVVFSDGVEADFLEFNSGRAATITTAERQARIIVP